MACTDWCSQHSLSKPFHSCFQHDKSSGKHVAIDNGDGGFSVASQSRGSTGSVVVCGNTGMPPCLLAEAEDGIPAWRCDEPLVIDVPGMHLDAAHEYLCNPRFIQCIWGRCAATNLSSKSLATLVHAELQLWIGD